MRFVSLTFALLMVLAPAAAFAQTDAGPVATDVVVEADAEDATDAADGSDATEDATDASEDAADPGSEVTPTPAPPVAPDAPETVEDASESLDFLVEAAKGGHWGLFFGVLLTLLVWLLDKLVNLKAKVGKKAMPWVAAGMGIMGTVGIALSSGLPVADALVQGLVTGASAVGLWELVFQHLLKKKEPEPSA